MSCGEHLSEPELVLEFVEFLPLAQLAVYFLDHTLTLIVLVEVLQALVEALSALDV